MNHEYGLGFSFYCQDVTHEMQSHHSNVLPKEKYNHLWPSFFEYNPDLKWTIQSVDQAIHMLLKVHNSQLFYHNLFPRTMCILFDLILPPDRLHLLKSRHQLLVQFFLSRAPYLLIEQHQSDC